MKNNFFLWLIPSLLIMVACITPACKKTGIDHSHVGGRVLEYGTNKPIAGAKVTLSRWSGEFLGGGAGGSSSASGVTYSNQDGYYSFDGLVGQHVLLVNARKTDYFSDLDTQQIVNDDGNYDDVDIILPPFAWLEVTLRNASGAYKFSGATGTYPDLPVKGFLLQKGETTSFLCATLGNKDYKYLFAVFPIQNQPPTNDISNIIIEKRGGTLIQPELGPAAAKFIIYLPGHDTTHITITY